MYAKLQQLVLLSLHWFYRSEQYIYTHFFCSFTFTLALHFVRFTFRRSLNLLCLCFVAMFDLGEIDWKDMERARCVCVCVCCYFHLLFCSLTSRTLSNFVARSHLIKQTFCSRFLFYPIYSMPLSFCLMLAICLNPYAFDFSFCFLLLIYPNPNHIEW